MQLDIRLLKKILTTIQEKQSHYTTTTEVLEDVNCFYSGLDRAEYIDLFFGHLLLLRDNNVIENVGTSNTLGVVYSFNGITYTPCNIRLTSKGYDFIKILNKNDVLDKLKRLTLTECLKVGEYILLNSLDSYIK